MITTIRHKGLRRLHETDDHRGVLADHADKLRRVLARLEASKTVADMDLPGYRLHTLRGNLAGSHAVTISGNWRIIFRFENGNALDVDYVDYH
jgi:toxin HigB-1